jgi:leader peptidase (prepilin peptidase)/N-methyltransferase
MIPTAALEVLSAVPVGWASALAARRLARSSLPSVTTMIATQAAIALSAVLPAPGPAAPVLLLAGWTLGLLAAVDALALRLPDLVTLPLGACGLILGPWLLKTPLTDHLIGAAAGWAGLAAIGWVYARLRGRDGLGLGDAKLLGAAGAWLGWMALPSVVVLACAGGLALAALKLLRRGRAGLADPIAFGLPLSGAIWVSLLLAVSSGGR